jgi:hypothetical protein
MNIFKDRKFLGKKAIEKALRWKGILNRLNRWILRIGLLFNALMVFMMFQKASLVLAFLFLVNFFYLAMVYKGRKLFID